MVLIVMADDGIPFDGDTPHNGPLGGAESAFVSLAEAFAKRGHEVLAYTKVTRPRNVRGVSWRPIQEGIIDKASLYIANRGDKLLKLVPGADQRIFWIHNPADYLLKWRYLSKLFVTRPIIVFSGAFHAQSCPKWVPLGGRKIIPYGISKTFTGVRRKGIAPPTAIFTSNVLRGLDWLLELWVDRIQPQVEGAELHIYSGPATYGSFGEARSNAMYAILEKAKSLNLSGVKVLRPVPKKELADVYANARVMLYGGDIGETFCLALGESQASGVPSVVKDIGCVSERIIPEETGYVARDDTDFVEKAVTLLRDDTQWAAFSDRAVEMQRGWTWNEAAEAFESLLPSVN
jgi:glycosyltransferase involved in cell wall biosynthesis